MWPLSQLFGRKRSAATNPKLNKKPESVSDCGGVRFVCYKNDVIQSTFNPFKDTPDFKIDFNKLVKEAEGRIEEWVKSNKDCNFYAISCFETKVNTLRAIVPGEFYTREYIHEIVKKHLKTLYIKHIQERNKAKKHPREYKIAHKLPEILADKRKK